MADEAEQVSLPPEPTPEPAPPSPAPEPVQPVIEPEVAPLPPDPGDLPSPITVTNDSMESLSETQPTSAGSASAPPAASATTRASAGAHMREVVRAKKQARLEKIVALAAEKRVITNDDVQKLLLVSHATATRYLSELVRSGRLKKSGHRRAARYEPL